MLIASKHVQGEQTMTRRLHGAMALALVLTLGALPALADAAPCPEPRGDGGRLSVTGTKLAAAHATQVIAGGRVSLAACGRLPGEGHVTPTPDFNVMLAEGEGRALEIRTRGECDTVLVVVAADGTWHYDDDGAGASDARIRIDAAPDGRYDVWVGTYDRSSCRARLILQTFQ
jgi:hypothetical protein